MGIARITLTTAGIGTGPFDLYADSDYYITPFETGISRAQLLAGFTSLNFPRSSFPGMIPTTKVRIQSTLYCTNYLEVNLPPVSTTTTTINPLAPTLTLSAGDTPWTSYSATPPAGTITNNSGATVYIWLGAGTQSGTTGSYSTNSPSNTLVVNNASGIVVYSLTYVTLTAGQSWSFTLSRTAGTATIMDVDIYWSSYAEAIFKNRV
jgi:hypothetical protein